MGATLCRNIEKSTKIPAKCCSKCSKEQLDGMVFTTFQSCHHILCKSCSVDNQIACPLQQVKPSLLGMSRKAYESIMPYDTSIFRQNCHKKHAMIWKNQYKICRKCLQACHGFQCRICSEYLCTFCSKTYNFASKKECPNRHRTQWEHKGVTCLICNATSNGWVCNECNFGYCTRCVEIDLQFDKCPNDHMTEWTAVHNQCHQCSISFHGWSCKLCNYNVCSPCSKQKFQQMKCPNNHPTEHGKGTCIRCDLTTFVMKCEKCRYFCCTKCELKKYNLGKMSTSSTERDYQTKISSVTIQNRFFQKAITQEENVNNEIKEKKSQSSEGVSNLKMQARGYLMEQNYKQAIQIYNKILQSQPKNIDVLLDLGQAYEFSKENAKALETYNRIQEVEKKCQKGSKKAVALILATSQDNNVNTLSDIEASSLSMYCEKIIKAEPSNIQYRLLNAQLQIRSKLYSSAVDSICTAITIAKDQSMDSLIEGIEPSLKELQQLNFHSHTIKVAHKIIEFCQKNPERKGKYTIGYWYNLIGMAMNKNGKSDEAREYFKKVKPLDIEYPKAQEFIQE